jgi:MFS transporter, PAT family, beta-lactamase induction signal transducer AmpG
MGTGAFSVLLLRLTQRRFSATQFALFSSLFGLPRILAGPVSGFLVDAIGWRAFFWFTIVCGFPGLALLARFVPPGTREPEFTIEPPASGEPLGTSALVGRGVAGALVAALIGAALLATLPWLKGGGFADALAAIVAPADLAGWLQLGGVVAFGAIAGLFTAAAAAARHGAPATEEF